jgi:glycosyltransferase involved in cell wall biosynthesis
MALHPTRDVVLLNSDTEVYGNWLDRLRNVAHRGPRTATVTPLSNNATIASYPRFLQDSPYPLETGYETLDRLTAKINAGVEAEAPTGIGFCMYLRSDALTDVGLFDEAAFGKGYGEENDFCQRAIERGWRNIIAADTFVRHLGGASFQGEKRKRIDAAMKVMARRHPGYQAAVEAFIRQDPLRPARTRLDWERLKQQAREENVLIVCHNRGGGTERHVQEDTQRLIDEGKGVFYLRPERGRPTHVRLGQPACRQLLNMRSFKLADTEVLAAALEGLRITRIHSHGLVDFAADAPKQLLALVRALEVPLHVDIHDYKVICPRLNLADQDGRYCKEPNEDKCDLCLTTLGNDFGVTSIRYWRRIHRRVLMAAEAVWVPDHDVAERIVRYYPGIHCFVTPHESLDASTVKFRAPRLQPAERLRVVVIGGISKIKGFDVLLACAQHAQKRSLPIDFVVMGYSVNDRLLEMAGVVVTGKYLEHEAEAKLHSLAPHVVWFPATWPETYSYTLSLALQCGYPVFAFDLGAIARRLRDLEHTAGLFPLAHAKQPGKLNQLFIQYRAGLLPAQGHREPLSAIQ